MKMLKPLVPLLKQSRRGLRISDRVVDAIYLDLCLGTLDRDRVRLALSSHLASPVATREDVIRECIAVAEALPPMRKISDAHVKATSPKDVAAALSTLLEGGR